MEWYIIGALVLVAGFVLYRYPVVRKVVLDKVFVTLKANEALIVLTVWNHLPPVVKKNIDSKTFADIVGLVLSHGVAEVEKELNK